MGNEGIFKAVAGEWRYGQGGRCLKSLTNPDLDQYMKNILTILVINQLDAQNFVL